MRADDYTTETDSTDADSPSTAQVETAERRHGRRQQNPPKKHGFVYFVRCCDDRGYIKFGFTKDVNGRISSLQCGNPYKLRLLASFESDNAAQLEAGLHHRFKASLVRCEWYEPTEDLLALIARIPTSTEIVARALLRSYRERDA